MIDSTTCVLCDAKCETDVSLDFHVKTIHQRLFVCTKCPAYTTMIRAKLKRHLETEHNQVPAKLGPATREDNNMTSSPDIQVVETTNKSKLSNQMQVKPAEPDNSPELVDPSKPVNPVVVSPLENPPLFVDNEDSSFECDHCWFATRKREEMLSHLVDKHLFTREAAAMFFKQGGLEPSQSVSEKTAASTAESSFLVVTTDSSQPTVDCVIKCGLCDFKTLTVDEMNSHLGSKGHFTPGKLPICPHCPYVASCPQELLAHGKSHFPAFALASYFCSKCNFKSFAVESIEKHQQTAHAFPS